MNSALTIYDINNNIKAYTKSCNILETITESQIANNHAVISRQEIRSFTAFLKLNSLLRVTNAIDITVVDNINKELRFSVNYQFQSVNNNAR
jgi:NADH:ubiquinone oxidoreductase subunit C